VFAQYLTRKRILRAVLEEIVVTVEENELRLACGSPSLGFPLKQIVMCLKLLAGAGGSEPPHGGIKILKVGPRPNGISRDDRRRCGDISLRSAARV
jgi:hypothetical protein